MKTENEIRTHIEGLLEARKDSCHLAHDEFNKGVKFGTDYVLEFINTKKLSVFVEKERRLIVRKIEEALETKSADFIGMPGLRYLTFCKAYPGIVSEETELLEGLIEHICDYIPSVSPDSLLYWKELPVIEKTDSATYIRATFAIA